MAASSRNNLLTVQAAFMAPVLVAFVIGSLPALLPILLYRSLVRKSEAAEPRTVQDAPAREIRAAAESDDVMPLLVPTLAAEGA